MPAGNSNTNRPPHRLAPQSAAQQNRERQQSVSPPQISMRPEDYERQQPPRSHQGDAQTSEIEGTAETKARLHNFKVNKVFEKGVSVPSTSLEEVKVIVHLASIAFGREDSKWAQNDTKIEYSVLLAEGSSEVDHNRECQTPASRAILVSFTASNNPPTVLLVSAAEPHTTKAIQRLKEALSDKLVKKLSSDIDNILDLSEASASTAKK